jgi:hypothetical protein
MDVYNMIMDSRKHQSLSGEKATIGKTVGDRFTAWGSHISGFNLMLKPGEKIVQAWRDRLVAGLLLHRHFRYQEGVRRVQAAVYAGRHPAQPLQRSLSRMD